MIGNLLSAVGSIAGVSKTSGTESAASDGHDHSHSHSHTHGPGCSHSSLSASSTPDVVSGKSDVMDR
jgi:hypothetical protein